MDNANKISDDSNGKILYSRSQDICSLAEALGEMNNDEEKEEIINNDSEEIFEDKKECDLELEDIKEDFLGDSAPLVIEKINISNENNSENDFRKMNAVETFIIKKKLLKIKDEIEEILKDLDLDENLKAYEKKITDVLLSEKKEDSLDIGAAKIIEGVFDGFEMISEAGETYEVPANYASKSKLVEGDILKLRILHNGAYRYKQIEKVERRNAIGILNYNEEIKEYFVILDNARKYKVLIASITYYKANVGDEIIITIPAGGESKWAAVEGIG
ncbi:MAG: hypothetical protein V1655_02560 [bacterium]